MSVFLPDSLLKFFGFALLVSLIFSACEDKKGPFALRFYAGPSLISENLNTLYSDSGFKKMRLEAPEQEEYTNGNQEYPRGLKVIFYNKDGSEKSYMKADFMLYNKQQDLYTATGNVVLEDIVKKEKLTTQKLHWSRIEGRVFNNEYVEINTPKQVLKGKGLTAKQDFSSYTILEPEGRILNADSDDFF
jgi:LPS export ABC transporter protein LptC